MWDVKVAGRDVLLFDTHMTPDCLAQPASCCAADFLGFVNEYARWVPDQHDLFLLPLSESLHKESE
jgi:hypothetical protein